ncbi:dephospho-CoA kinase [Simplicispira psychrophila]|uniref:dephospho-CoA kinase n=1 Tax=Simplicispira psychrophila TaxID=80882 RepID=UPI0004848594|nr:dephospho-CoA kinase [Simplicispira psychrophila]
MSTHRQHTTRLGLTGGIGSGKSTVAQILVHCGAVLIDADCLARTVTGPGGAAMAAIAQTFGPDYIDANGALHRDRMRALAFSAPASRKRLEAIVHPLVGQLTTAQVDAAVAAGQRLVVFDIPLLVESGHWRRQLDAVVVVDCRIETQMGRVMARNALAPEAIENIITAQASRSARRAAADVVLYNDGLSLQALQAQVHQVAVQFGL